MIRIPVPLLPAAILIMALAACQRQAPEPELPEPVPTPEAEAGPSAPQDEASAGDDGETQRPRLRVATLDGESYDLADRRGKWVVVNFWATWCTPCLKEMPELSALAAMREHVEVIGLAYEDIEEADMRAFLEKHPVAYPIAIVDVYAPPADFETPRGLPMTYLIAPDGSVANRYLGPVTAADLERDIAAAGGPDAPEAEASP